MPDGQLTAVPLPGRLVIERPLSCAPHHSAPRPLVVGGNGLTRPGAVSLPHQGALFLDEAPEFNEQARGASWRASVLK
ncbi:ATP-binding protein [Streptomyces sp. NPDC059718]